MLKRFSFLLVAAALLIAVGAGCSGGAEGGGKAGAVAVQEPWAREAKAGANSAVYFVIQNQGEADTLLSAKCDAAMMVELHKTQTDASGNSSMMHQESVPIPAGEKVSFEPGGLHVMLMKLKKDLKPGETLPVTLQFEKAGTVTVQAAVKEP